MRVLWLLPLLLVAPVQELPPLPLLCPYETTASGGGYYLVMVGDSAVSRHVQEREAVGRAAWWETIRTAEDVRVVPDFEIRVECPLDWAEKLRPDTTTAPEAASISISRAIIYRRDGTVDTVYLDPPPPAPRPAQ